MKGILRFENIYYCVKNVFKEMRFEINERWSLCILVEKIYKLVFVSELFYFLWKKWNNYWDKIMNIKMFDMNENVWCMEFI